MFLFSFTIVLIIILVFTVSDAVAQEYNKNSCYSGEHTIPNPSPDPDTISPEIWYFQIPTTVTGNGINIVGDNGNNMIVIEIHREWSPLGADRLYSLVKDNYYDCATFFRVVPQFMVQWGIASNPTETEKWKTPIQDDPVLESISNTMGMVSYAKTGPNSRTRQIFVNTVDNTFLDPQGFTPFGKVVKGMDVLTSMYVSTPVPNQQTYIRDGNTWLLQEYPDIDMIKSSEQKIFFALDDTMETDDNISGSSSTYSTITITIIVLTITSFVALVYML